MNEWVDGTATNTKRAEKEKKIDARHQVQKDWT